MTQATVEIDADYHPGQLEVSESPARFKVVCAGRRWGKTRWSCTECFKVALNGGRAWWVAPTYATGLEGWRPMSRIARSQLGGISRVREIDKQIQFANGGLIEVRTAKDPQNLRGAGLDLLVMDEAAQIKSEAWYEVLRPSLSDRRGKAIFISTPKGIDNWFYDLYESADRDDWARWQFPTASNPHIDPTEIESARIELGPSSPYFSQEYLAEFIAQGGAVFDPDWFTYYEIHTRDDGVREFLLPDGSTVDWRDTTRFVTVDPALSVKESADFTVAASVASVGPWVLVLDVFRDRIEFPQILPTVRAKMKAHDLGVAHFESTAFQKALIQQARAEGMAVAELKADRDKLARAAPLAARMEAGQVLWPADAPWVPELEKELRAFTGVQNEHDDQVDALAYAVRVASQRPKLDLSGWSNELTRTSPNRI